MEDVLHQLIDRVRFHTEAEVREAHQIVSDWFAQHFAQPASSSSVDSPAPGAVSATPEPEPEATKSD